MTFFLIYKSYLYFSPFNLFIVVTVILNVLFNWDSTWTLFSTDFVPLWESLFVSRAYTQPFLLHVKYWNPLSSICLKCYSQSPVLVPKIKVEGWRDYFHSQTYVFTLNSQIFYFFLKKPNLLSLLSVLFILFHFS